MSPMPGPKSEDSGIGIGPHDEPAESSNKDQTSSTSTMSANAKVATPSSAPVEESYPTPRNSMPVVPNGAVDLLAPEAADLPDDASEAGSQTRLIEDAPESEAEIETVTRRFEYISYDTGDTIFESNEAKYTHNVKRPGFEFITTAYSTRDSPTKEKDDGPGKRRPPVRHWGPITIVINSPAALDALRTVCGYWPYGSMGGESIRILEPFDLVVHHWDQLHEYREQFDPSTRQDDCTVADSTFEEVGILLDLVHEVMGKAMEEERARHARDVPVCTQKMLWLLLKPGTDVYYDRDDDGDYNPFVIRMASWTFENGTPLTYTIGLWNMDCDEKHIGASRSFDIKIDPFVAERRIGSLPVFPCKYLNQEQHNHTHDERRKHLEARGAQFFKLLQGKQFVGFDGLGDHWPNRRYTSACVIDMWQYSDHLEKNDMITPELQSYVDDSIAATSKCECERCKGLLLKWVPDKTRFKGYVDINPSKVDGLEPHQYFLCSRRIGAFVQKEREWVYLRVDGFHEAKHDTEVIETLVMPESTRNLIKNLSKRYTRQDGEGAAWSADFIKGKGKGMIFLLHGKPGVGKTYTAECVAEATKRPLITLNCSDIGTHPGSVEKKLEYWFRLASTWGAILLIDEADVYMEQRTISDLERNVLVAGFLRRLEYYSGILFLTTNRVGTFDEAFMSRIDIPIYYPDLTDDQRLTIWHNFFRKLETEKEEEMRVAVPAKRFVEENPKLLALKWNAREIRNAFQTAVALAEVEAKKDSKNLIAVTDQHLETVVNMSKDFKDYLATVFHGKSEGDRAAARGLRADEYGSKPERRKGSEPY